MEKEIVSNIEWVFNADPIKILDGTEFLKSKIDLITQIDDFFISLNREVFREGLGVVNLTRRGIKASIAHGIGRKKAVAFAAVPDVIKYGKIIEHQINWKERGYDTYVIDAPISIDNIEYIAEVIIEQNKSKKNEFYLHEVETKEKAQSAFKTATERSAPQALEKVKSTFKTATEHGVPSTSRLIITQMLNKINEKI